MTLKFPSVVALLLGLFLLLVVGSSAHAAPPFLTVDGAIRSGEPVGDGRLRRVFSEAEVLAMPTESITTLTDWRPRTDYVGPSLASVLKAAGAVVDERTRVQLTALNDYSVTIPGSDLQRYRPVLAHTSGGKRLARRDFGPLWLMYPRDDHEELRNNASAAGKMIWQVTRITVH